MLDADPVQDVHHCPFPSFVFGSCVLDGLGDPLDALQPGVPGRADVGQLGGGAGELGLVDPVAPLAPGRVACTSPTRSSTPRCLATAWRVTGRCSLRRGRGPAAVGQQQVEHPSPGRVPDRRPEVVVDHRCSCAAPSLPAYTGDARQEEVPAGDVVAVLCLEHGALPAHLAEPGLGHPQQRAVPCGLELEVTSSELPCAADSPAAWVQRNENSRGGRRRRR